MIFLRRYNEDIRLRRRYRTIRRRPAGDTLSLGPSRYEGISRESARDISIFIPYAYTTSFQGYYDNKRNLYHYRPHGRDKFLEDATPTLPVGYQCRGRFEALWPNRKRSRKEKVAFRNVMSCWESLLGSDHRRRTRQKKRDKSEMKTTYDAFSMTGDKRRLSEEKNHKRIPYVKLIIACKGSDDVRWMVIRLKVYATWHLADSDSSRRH